MKSHPSWKTMTEEQEEQVIGGCGVNPYFNQYAYDHFNYRRKINLWWSRRPLAPLSWIRFW